jgi:hypothetical protein
LVFHYRYSTGGCGFDWNSIPVHLENLQFTGQFRYPTNPSPTPTPTSLPLANGDFETGPYNTQGVVTGWSVSGGAGKIQVKAEGATSSTHSAALSAGGDSDGNVLSQSFLTNAGQTYTLDFDAGVFGQRTGAPLLIRVQVLGSGTLVDRTVAPPDARTLLPAGDVPQTLFHCRRGSDIAIH